MSNESVQVEVPENLSRESLMEGFPRGPKQQQPEEVPAEAAEEAENEELAEAQDSEEGDELEAAEQPEGALGAKMDITDFAREAGVSLESLYRDLVLKRPTGETLTLSEAVDATDTLRQANEALLRERSELQKKADIAATQAPVSEISPEAQALMARAEIFKAALDPQNFQGVDAATAANQKFELMQSYNQLVQAAQVKQMEWNNGRTEKMAQAKEEAGRQIRSRIPEWSDAGRRAEEQTQIADLAHAYGYSRQEVDEIFETDPRGAHLLRDMLQAKQKQARIEKGVQKVRKVPKTMPATARVEAKKPSLAEAGAKLRDLANESRETQQKARLNIDLGSVR